jgi:uncharacterized protein YndB with AHSA1/START domain
MTDATYTVERSETIAAPPSQVFEQVVDFHRWPAWSPWEGIDPDMRRSYEGPESGVGSAYAWSGNRKAGEGRMEITSVEEPSTVVIDLVFVKPFKSKTLTTFTFEPVDTGTRVHWKIVGPMTMATRVMGLFTSMDRLVGKDFAKGLTRLKAVVETPGS